MRKDIIVCSAHEDETGIDESVGVATVVVAAAAAAAVVAPHPPGELWTGSKSRQRFAPELSCIRRQEGRCAVQHRTGACHDVKETYVARALALRVRCAVSDTKGGKRLRRSHVGRVRQVGRASELEREREREAAGDRMWRSGGKNVSRGEGGGALRGCAADLSLISKNLSSHPSPPPFSHSSRQSLHLLHPQPSA